MLGDLAPKIQHGKTLALVARGRGAHNANDLQVRHVNHSVSRRTARHFASCALRLDDETSSVEEVLASVRLAAQSVTITCASMELLAYPFVTVEELLKEFGGGSAFIRVNGFAVTGDVQVGALGSGVELVEAL